MVRKLLYAFLLSMMNFVVLAGIYDKVIIPVEAEEIKDTTISREVTSILKRIPLTPDLKEYKTKWKGSSANSMYLRGNWMFNIELATSVNEGKYAIEKQLPVSQSQPLIENISFYHVTSMLQLSKSALSKVNEEILSHLSDRSVNCIIRCYASQDRYRHYLELTVGNNRERLNLIFIVKDSEFYQCVFAATS